MAPTTIRFLTILGTPAVGLLALTGLQDQSLLIGQYSSLPSSALYHLLLQSLYLPLILLLQKRNNQQLQLLLSLIHLKRRQHLIFLQRLHCFNPDPPRSTSLDPSSLNSLNRPTNTHLTTISTSCYKPWVTRSSTILSLFSPPSLNTPAGLDK